MADRGLNIAPRIILGVAVTIALVFGSAGRWDLPFVWVYLALLVGAAVVSACVMDRGLIRERTKPGPGGVDRSLRFIILPFFVGHLVVAMLDVGRFHWSGVLPAGLQAGCLAGMAASFSVSIWATRVNRFFSPVVRIQSERGHHLVTGGPYRWVRHPGYTAATASSVCSGPALGSWWSILALVPVLILLLRRTLIEDRFLREQLDGYAEYAKRVRYRLIPGVW